MRAPWIADRPTAPQPITATRAPAQTFAVSSTDITPVATAQPIRHACSTGSSAGTRTAATAGTTVCVAKCPGAQDGRQHRPVGAMQPAGGGRRLPAAPWCASQAGGAGAARRLPAEHDAVAGGEGDDVRADAHDGARALVTEQHRERMPPPVLVDHVLVAVADAGRLDPDEHFPRLRRVDPDLFERQRAAAS